MEDTLLILDGVDKLWKKHKSQFRMWLIDIAGRFGAKILLSLRQPIQDELHHEDIINIKELELTKLNDYESADLLLAATKKTLTLDDL